MEILIVIIIISFIVGLLTRDKGDGFLDTVSSGCGTIFWIILIIIGILYFMYS
jgi:hypothetical protein